MNLLREKVSRAIQRGEVATSQKPKLVQLFAPLKSPKSIFKHWPNTYWLNTVQDGAHLRVAGNTLFSENIAKPDISASGNEILAFSARWSGTCANPERINANRLSADRDLFAAIGTPLDFKTTRNQRGPVKFH
ncbi:MAG: hypothetical protein ACW97O_17785 [Candidatus Thorarchaeota archaeon]